MLAVALAGMTLGCAGADEATYAAATLSSDRPTAAEYEATFERAPTEIGRADAIAERTRADLRGTLTADTFIDASDGRTEFPMPSEVRRFESEGAYVDFLERELGLQPGATSGSYAMVGTPYWTDGTTGVRYVVTDPIAAFIGGVTGQLVVAGEERCLDRDGACDVDRRASHLVPEGEFTRPTNVTRYGSGGMRADWHSFYNWTWFPWPWARHGSNTKINLAPLPSTHHIVGGQYWYYVPLYYAYYPADLPVVDVWNTTSAETAVWTAAPSGPVWDATAVCGGGTIDDPDVYVWDRYQETGNGPQNNTWCGP